MNRVKDIVIVILLLAVAYLLVTRDHGADMSEHKRTAAVAVAVLPFADMSADASEEYIADSLWDDTLTYLAQRPELKILARTPLAGFRGTREDVRTIGRELGVAFVAEGAVTKTDTGIRVTAQLVRVDDGAHIWTETFTSGEASAHGISGAIAASVASRIENSQEL